MLSVLFYICIFTAVSLIIYVGKDKPKDSKKINISIAVACTILTVISAIRYNVGTDYQNYVIMYNVFNLNNFKDIIDILYQPAFNLVLFISKYIFSDVNFVFYISSIIIGFFLYKILDRINNHKYNALIMLLFAFLLFAPTFNMVRQAIAMLIGIYAVFFLIDKKYLKFTFLVVLASMFHITALILLVVGLFIVMVIKSTKKQMVLLFILAALLLILSPYIMQVISNIDLFKHFSIYDAQAEINLSAMIKTLLIRVPLYFYIILNSKELLKDKSNKVWLILVAFEVLCIFGKSIFFEIQRLIFYFSFASYVLAAKVVLSDINKKYRKLTIPLIYAYCIVFFIWSFYILGHSDIIPYQTIF